jgi:putative aldouronate transport system permease protein
MYEAATVDGAGRWAQLWHITIPGIIPTVLIMLILRVDE